MAPQLTKKEFEKLQAQLEDMETRGIAEAAEEIRRAREFGDIAENAEYDEAKTSQARLFRNIEILRERILNADVVNPSKSTKVVGLGSVVEIREVGGKKKMSLKVSSLVDGSAAVVTPESPMGRALLGSKVGDIIEIQARVPWRAKILAVKRGG
jgi:transcription elongation factor GreA